MDLNPFLLYFGGVAGRQGGASCLRRRWRGGAAETSRKIDVGLPGMGNSNSHGASPVHLIIIDSDQQVVITEVSLCRKVRMH